MKNQGLRWLKLLAIAMLALPAFAAHPASAQANCQTFTETGHQVCGTFLNYWTNNGALAQQGYPITEPVSETSDTDGKIYTVQYFERAVFEEHPEFAGTSNEVLLQLLGVFFYQSRYPGGHPAPGGNPPPPAAPTATPVPAPPPATQAPAPPSGGSIQVSGHGTQVSQPIELKRGLAVYHTVHTNGESNFIVHLVDMSGKVVDFLTNEIGNVDMSTADHIPSDGQYMFEVDADGDWTITVTQPQGTYSTPPATQQWSGHGSQATAFFSLHSGGARFQLVHTNGTSNFIVHLVDSQGNTQAFLANEIGPTNISTIENIPTNGVYLLVIDADGDWNINVQQTNPADERLAQSNCQTFNETGKTVCDNFLAYWTSHGALRQQGYPISDEFIEVNQLDGKPYKVQYFERAVFEYHPEFAGTPNEVLLSQLGTFQNTRKHSAPTPVPVAPTAVPAQPTPTTAPPPPAATATSAPADPCSGLPPVNANVITIPTNRCGPAGTAFGWTARGFHPNENVGVYITLPDGSVAGAPFQVSTDDQGRVLDGVTFGTRPGFPLGRYAITFEGVASHITQIEYFQLIP